MDKKVEKKPIIKSRIIQFIENQSISKTDFCKKTGISYSNIKGNAQKSELGGEQISKILESYPEISPDWLLTGSGLMLREPSILLHNDKLSVLPLISHDTFLHLTDNHIPDGEIEDYYIIPIFNQTPIDFLIKISGSGMSPYLNSGDIAACTLLRNYQFIQWNRCHIIATHSQGVLCKRLKPSRQKDCFTAVSENPQYPPFDIPICDIGHIALVLGSVNIE